MWAIMVNMAIFATVRRLLNDKPSADEVSVEESNSSFGLSPAGLTAITVAGLGFLAVVATLGAGPVVAGNDGTETARATIFCPLGATVSD